MSDKNLAEFQELHSSTRRGDIVAATGYPGKSKKAELSLFAVSFGVLAPCLRMLPKNKLTNQVQSDKTLQKQMILKSFLGHKILSML